MTIAPAMTPMMSATCCFHGVASTSWPVFKSCKLLLAIAATLKITAVEEGECDQRLACIRRDIRLHPKNQKQRRADHDENADAGERTVRGTDEARHVAANGGNKEAHQHDIKNAADHQGEHVAAETAGVRKISED